MFFWVDSFLFYGKYLVFSHVHVWFRITCVKDRMDVSCNILVLFIVFIWSFRWENSHSIPYISTLSSLYSANNAVDRNTDTCTRTRAIGYGPQFHVVFWVVDFGSVHNIYSIDGMYTYNPKHPEKYISWPNCFSLTKIEKHQMLYFALDIFIMTILIYLKRFCI